jgi:hypothetical protein
MAQDKIFADGLIFKAPSANAPAFILGGLSVKVDEFIKFLNTHNTNSGWINIDIKESKEGGKWYCELNTYVPQKPNLEPEKADTVEYPPDEIDPADIPF